MCTVSQTIQRQKYPRHPKSLIQHGRAFAKKYRPQGAGLEYPIRVAHPPRNKDRLAGLADWVRTLRCGAISDFATLVRKSYSDALSPVSNLVLEKRTLKKLTNLGTFGLPRSPRFPGYEIPEARG